MAAHPSVPAWTVPWTEGPGGLRTVHGFAKSQTRLKRFSTHAGVRGQPWSFCPAFRSHVSRKVACAGGEEWRPLKEPRGGGSHPGWCRRELMLGEVHLV